MQKGEGDQVEGQGGENKKERGGEEGRRGMKGDKEDMDYNLLTCEVSWDKILFPVNVCNPCTRHLFHNHLRQRGTKVESKLPY